MGSLDGFLSLGLGLQNSIREEQSRWIRIISAVFGIKLVKSCSSINQSYISLSFLPLYVMFVLISLGYSC